MDADLMLDTSWLDNTMPDIPDLTPDDAAMVERVVARAVAMKNAKPKPMRKKEDPAASPS